MKKFNKNLIMLCSISSLSFISYAETFQLGKINIRLSGEVVAYTCGVLEREKDKYVNLGTYSTKNFNTVGKKGNVFPIPFNLYNCLPNIPFTLTFSGNSDASNADLLALDQQTNSAKNIAIEILTPNKTRLPLNKQSESFKADSNGNLSTTFYANYIVTKNSPTAGVANATAQFTIQYD